jgi:3',5'-cyclic AMP phosphodiesterase CpdA
MTRIAHLSDIHISSPTATLARLWQGKRLLGGMNMLLFRRHELQNLRFPALLHHLEAQHVDHIILSGDLTTTALHAEFQHARLELNPFFKNHTLTTIPGNHDIYTPREADERRYEHYFAETHGLSESQHGYPFVKIIPPHIAIIGLNSCVPTGLSGAWGLLDDEQLQRLPALLRAHQDHFRILVLHHFLLDRHGYHGLPRRGLRNRDALLSILQKEGCELVLHGHEHARYRYTLDGPQGPIPVHNPGPATCVSSARHHPGGYLIYDIQDQRIASIQGFVLSYPDGHIQPDDTFPSISPIPAS